MLEERIPHKTEETRTRIVAATRSLFARKGRRGTTTREIAELAGVNEATLFRHFGNKDALIDACVQHYCSTMELQDTVSALSGDLRADLRTIALMLMSRMEAVRDLITRSLLDSEEEGTPVDDAAWSRPNVIHRIVMEFMARRVAAGELVGDPQLLGRMFTGMIFSYVIGRRKFPLDERTTAEAFVDFQLDVFLNGSRSRTS